MILIHYMIIAGFPCIGKTTLANKSKDVLDLASTKFHYILEDSLISEKLKGNECGLKVNAEWPQNYINEIINSQNKYKIIFILARDYILEELNRIKIPYFVAVPEDGLKEEYIARAINRGNDENFIEGFQLRYNKWRNLMISQPVEKIYLQQGEFIEDTLKRLKIFGG